jgi:site-specific DNA recombinase
MREGHLIKRIYIDAGISGSSTENRMALHRMIAELEPNDIVVTYQISRLTRNMADGLSLIDQIKGKGAQYISLDLPIDSTSPIGEHQLYTWLSLAHMERRVIAQRVHDTMQTMKIRGTLRYKPCYGWKHIEKGMPHQEVPEEQIVIERIFRESTNKSANDISRMLNTERVPCRNAKAWYAQTVLRILSNEKCKEKYQSLTEI